MTIANSRPFGQRYAFVVVGVIFLCLLIAAGLRSSMSVMMVPLEDAFGWRRDVISLAAAVGIFLYGLAGPFAAAADAAHRHPPHRCSAALALMSASTGAQLLDDKTPWQLVA
jgi:SNF family Na+-dependent transporter